MRYVLATFAGLLVAAILTFGIESLGSVFFPLPEGADPMDIEWIKNNMNLIPTGAMIMVALAHVVGIICGMLVAGLIAKNSMIPAYVVAVLMLLGTIANLFMIPHPTWFMFVDIVGALIAIYIGKTLVSSKLKGQSVNTAA